MIILDENFPDSQRRLLRSWRVPIRQIGYELGRGGMQDEEIPSFLLSRRRVTFFTLDQGFHNRRLRHARYCLVYLDVGQYEAAAFVRRVLRHPQLDNEAKRLGLVLRASHSGINGWKLHMEQEVNFKWPR